MRTYTIYVIYLNQETDEAEGLSSLEVADWIHLLLLAPYNPPIKIEIELVKEMNNG